MQLLLLLRKNAAGWPAAARSTRRYLYTSNWVGHRQVTVDGGGVKCMHSRYTAFLPLSSIPLFHLCTLNRLREEQTEAPNAGASSALLLLLRPKCHSSSCRCCNCANRCCCQLIRLSLSEMPDGHKLKQSVSLVSLNTGASVSSDAWQVTAAWWLLMSATQIDTDVMNFLFCFGFTPCSNWALIC